MTEEEAKKKMCPMTLSRESGDYHWNCMGSDCMAWRVSSQAKEAVIQKIECETGSAPEGEGWEIKESGVDDAEEGHPRYSWTIWKRVREPAKPEQGFCGAFGAPLVVVGQQDHE